MNPITIIQWVIVVAFILFIVFFIAYRLKLAYNQLKNQPHTSKALDQYQKPVSDSMQTIKDYFKGEKK